MPGLAPSNLPPISQTSLFTLVCRARETLRPDALLRDARALELYRQLEGETAFIGRISSFDQASTSLRASHYDAWARQFLALHPEGLVVDLGCGLDTRFWRLDQGQMTWLGLDLPEIIAWRQRFLPASARCLNLAGSLLENTWMDTVAAQDLPPIFLAEGVLPYLAEAQVKALLSALAVRFPGAEIVFDIYSPWLIKHHNRDSQLLRETGARLNWAIADMRELTALNLRVLDSWGYFDKIEPRWGLFNLMRVFPFMRNSSRVVHARLDQSPSQD